MHGAAIEPIRLEYTMRVALPDTQEFSAVREIAGKLHAAGFAAAVVGGAVRDLLSGKTPRDFDLVTTARPEQLAKLFDRTRLVGASFGVTLVGKGAFDFEVATARLERNYLDGRHPGEIRYADRLADDVVRRDFTINALLLDPVTGEVEDRVGGVADLKRGVLRTVGDPATRFREDYLRMLRAVRFASRLDFDLDPAVEQALAALAPLAAELTGERIRQELENMLLGPHPGLAFRRLERFGLLRAVLPEVAALVNVAQPPQFHPEGDVFTHTMLMLDHFACPDRISAWSALLHDIGKPGTFSIHPEEDNRIRFFGHETLGAEMSERVCDRLRFSAADRDAVAEAIRGHMRMASVISMRPAKLRRLIGKTNFGAELELHRLDCLSSHGRLDCFVFLLDQLRKYSASPALPPPWIRGRELIAAGKRPSARFGGVLTAIYDRQLAGEFTDASAALAAALALLDDGSAPGSR